MAESTIDLKIETWRTICFPYFIKLWILILIDKNSKNGNIYCLVTFVSARGLSFHEIVTV